MIDSTLSWHVQIDNISKKISRSIGLVYKIRLNVNIKVMKTLYYILVYSHLRYVIEVWDLLMLHTFNYFAKKVVRLLTYSDIRRSYLMFHDIFRLRTYTKSRNSY